LQRAGARLWHVEREACPFVTGAPSGFASALERDKSSESGVREAVLSGFDVTRKSILESRVSGNREDHVIPAKELIERQLDFKLGVRLEKPHEGLFQWRNYEPWLGPLKDSLGDALIRYRV
jgi:hypothetical protein